MVNMADKINHNANRITALEEHNRDRDKHDDRLLELMGKIQKDVHTLTIRVEKGRSMIAGFCLAFSLMGGTVGVIITYFAKKSGIIA